MCHAFGSAVERIAASGKAVYDLPCYANAWLEQWPWEAGTYPSGGPVAKMFKMWKLVAPSLSCLAPDIYVPYVADVADEYARQDNALFIPEVRKDAMASTYALYTVLGKHAICYSPFGIEDIRQDPKEVHMPPMALMIELNIDPSAFNMEGSSQRMEEVFGFIQNVAPIYYKYRRTDDMKSFLKRGQYHYGDILNFGDYSFKLNYSSSESGKAISGGGIIRIGENEFLIYGMRTRIEYRMKRSTGKKAGILELAEARVEKGEIVKGRVLNGDEQMFVSLDDGLTCLKLSLYGY